MPLNFVRSSESFDDSSVSPVSPPVSLILSAGVVDDVGVVVLAATRLSAPSLRPACRCVVAGERVGALLR